MELSATSHTRLARTLAWCLRVALLLQVCGTGVKYWLHPFEVDSPLFEQMLFDWRWPEPTAQAIDDGLVWAVVASGVAVFVLAGLGAVTTRLRGRPSWLDRRMLLWQVPLLVLIVAWEILIAATTWYRRGDFLPESMMLSHAVRYGVPLALLLLTPRLGNVAVALRKTAAAMWLLRIAAAATFIGHGWKAIERYSRFTDYILVASDKLPGYDLSQAAAERLLVTIGYVDMAVALLLVIGRFRTVAVYMALWGLITAYSRVIYSGPTAYYEVLIRGGNYGAPFAVAVYFFWLHRRRGSESPALYPEGERSHAKQQVPRAT